jgi:dynein heavy chain
MCPPAGGKNQVTPRFTRHFNIITCHDFDRDVLKRIFEKIMVMHIRKEQIRGDNQEMMKKMVEATISVFDFAKEELRPTPAKSHYLFNLRDVSRVIQGIMMIKLNNTSHNMGKLVRLWVHENARVFSDRLIQQKDV